MIKNELLDLRKNRKVVNKVTPDSSFNLPLNRSHVNDTVSAKRNGETTNDLNFFTPTRDTERTTAKKDFSISNAYDNFGAFSVTSSNVLSIDKTPSVHEDFKRSAVAKNNLNSYAAQYKMNFNYGKDDNYKIESLRSDRSVN